MSAQEVCLSLAILITLVGVWLHWHMHHYRMGAEEAIKERKLSADQVDRRLMILKHAANTLTIVGMILLVLTITVMAE
jgi:hypothetical protein